MSRTLGVAKALFYLNVIFLILLSIPFVYLDPGPQTRVITLLALFPIAIMLLASAVLTYTQSTILDF
jgi:hypothetical protein